MEDALNHLANDKWSEIQKRWLKYIENLAPQFSLGLSVSVESFVLKKTHSSSECLYVSEWKIIFD